jgi:pimeloyl-ACP methyl ester carboxylesterase
MVQPCAGDRRRWSVAARPDQPLDPDQGLISRRTLVVGGAAVAVAATVAAYGGDYELQRHPTLRSRLFGCGSTPAIPTSDYAISTGTIRSAAMGATIPWATAMPRDADQGAALPLIVALPGEGGRATDFATGVGLPGFATSAGLRACFVSCGDVASTYYHPRADGTNYFGFVVDELVPEIERRTGAGGGRSRRAVYGWSMGGFGALLVAQQRPGLVCAAVGSSPAAFASYHAAVTGHPDTFDSAADWERWGLWEQVPSMGRVAVLVDCGDADPFAPTARQLLRRIPGAGGAIGAGCHDTGFWRRAAPGQIRFLADRLSG